MSVATIPQNQSTFLYAPSTLEEALSYAKIIAESGLCPDALKGKSKDVLLIVQMGAEIGLKPMQALRALGVINGRVFAWGDGLFALAKRHPEFEGCKEWFEGSIKDGNLTAFCHLKRKGNQEATQSFSMEDAMRASLWNKKGPWSLYPKRMLQMRARGYCVRDVYPDAFYNILTQDEAFNIDDSNHKSTLIKSKGINALEATLGVNDQNIEDAQIVEPIKIVDPNFDSDWDKFLKDTNGGPIDTLKYLIRKAQIPYETTYEWCKKAQVKSIDELSDDHINKAINFLKAKEIKNAI